MSVVQCLQDYRHVHRPPASLSHASKDSSVGSLHKIAIDSGFSEGTSNTLAGVECSAAADSSDDSDEETKQRDDDG